MGTCWRERRAVLITVYVEKPRSRALSSNDYHHLCRHRHRHWQIQGNDINGKGYNRRAELLHYSGQLRNSARLALPSAGPRNSNQHIPQDTSVQKRAEYASSPSCCGNYNFFLPKFLNTWSNFQAKIQKKKIKSTPNKSKINALLKSLQMQKKRGLLTQMFSKLRKRK